MSRYASLLAEANEYFDMATVQHLLSPPRRKLRPSTLMDSNTLGVLAALSIVAISVAITIRFGS